MRKFGVSDRIPHVLSQCHQYLDLGFYVLNCKGNQLFQTDLWYNNYGNIL